MTNQAKDKITIKGTPRQYSQEELDSRIASAELLFSKSQQSKHRLQRDLPQQLLLDYEELVKQGYSLSTDFPLDLHTPPYVVHLNKPEHLLTKDVEAVKRETKQRYIEELEAEHQHYQSLLVQQLVEAEEEKQRTKQEAEREKLVEKFKQQAANTYTPLSIPA
ncbi:MAG: hypothetical protein ACTH5D_04555 [Halomonas sp.]|uniref:hypothetical protein n=1 Tax=Halomonas sp. TaxID=1486246 RepID=UPI003F93172F